MMTDPLANPESIVLGKHYRFTLISDMVLRYEWSEDGLFEDRASTFVINRNFPKPDYRVAEDKDDLLQIITPSLHLTYDKRRFSPHGLHVIFNSKQHDWGSEWRYGSSEPDPYNLGGTARTLDEVDGPCDMGSGILSRLGFASVDDSQSALFEGDFMAPRKPGDRIDGYLFSYGADYRGAIRALYTVSGAQSIIPRWSLGNWWSRYYTYHAQEYLDLMDTFRERGIPLSVAVIDMDWHPVRGDEVPHAGWTGYTWNRSLFPDPAQFLRALHDRGLKCTLNDHPHSGIHRHEDMYGDVAQALGHDTTHGAPILFDPTSRDYMHAYFNIVHRRREAEGCDFWWTDWQQGRSSRVAGIDPLWILNHFQYVDQARRDLPSSHPIIFSRYAGPGSHRNPVGFSGDTHATWASLAFQPEFTATASNIGYGWWSHDIGGHTAGVRDDELTARWVQLGVFSPVLRLHSCNIRWMSKEPWRYRHEADVAMRASLQLRHRLVPYIYSSMMGSDHHQHHEPLVQPMYWEFPTRNVAYRFPNQYRFGSCLVVNPVVTPRDTRTNRARTKVWVPPGRHVDILTGFVYDGDREMDTYRSLLHIPVLAPEGSLIPLDANTVPANGCRNPTAFTVLVVVGRNGQFSIVEDTGDDDNGVVQQPQRGDDGQKQRRSIHITYHHESGRLTTLASGKAWKFHFVSLMSYPSSPIRVFIDETDVSEDATISASAFPELPGAVVSVPRADKADSLIRVELGTNPQLSVLDHTALWMDIIEDLQIENATKDRLWDVLQADQPALAKVSGLLSLELDEAIVGPFIEALTSDGRAGGVVKA